MKTQNLQKILAVLAVTGLGWSAAPALAQDSSVTMTARTAAANASAPQLAYGVPQVLQLKQAEVGDDTIIAYIKNSGNIYNLNADQIIYLRQQGLSDAVVTAMLNQPKPAMAVAAPATPAPQPVASAAEVAPVAATTAAPAVTYVQTVPATYYYQPYYYPVYSCFPAVSFSFGWHGGGYYGGYGGWHGGGYGGWHGGGGGWHH